MLKPIIAALAVAGFVAPATATAKPHRHRHHRVARHHITPKRYLAPIAQAHPAAPPAAADMPRATSIPAAPEQQPPLPPPSLIGVGNVPGCAEQGADPTATLQAHSASVLRVIIDFRNPDAALPCVQTAAANGYKVELVMQWRGEWTSDQVLGYFKSTVPEYAPFVWAVAIGNEQDLIQGSQAETPAQYADVWRTVEPFTRQTVPQAILVGGEIGPWSWPWLREEIADGGMPGAQAISAHAYAMGPASFDPSAFVEWAQTLGLPVWFDEGLAGDGAWGPDVPLEQLAGAQMAAMWLS